MNCNILICDDEKDIVSALKIYLSAEGYNIFEAGNGAEALNIVKSSEIHLILMDIMMPEMDGITALGKIREICNAPVILLTAKSEDTDKILGLNVGADDYITKPFNPMELLARVRSQLRRYMMLGGGKARSETISFGGIELDDRSKTVTVDGEEVALTPTEYEILKLLMSNPGKVFSITPDELSERFVRGDESRSTEGSGLGLAIAKSLAKLQKVGFNISIDGDLFKVILTFEEIC